MRLSVSCERCRQAKVKCVHEGSPPCRRCQKGQVQGCTLSSPRSSPRINISAIKDGDSGKRRQTIKSSSSRLVTSPRNSPSTRLENDNNPHGKTSTNPLLTVPTSTIIDACEIYRKKFPVANFLHYPSLISDLSSDHSKVDPVFIASLLSMCTRFMSGRGLEDEEVYAEYARSEVSRRAFEAPSLSIAQSLVILSFYEWGSGHPYKSWMYIGMAMYMIQSLLRMTDDTMEQNPQEFHSLQTQYELLVRTYWVCFSQDCELSSGARQHFALSFRSISVPLPISDHDFTFNKHPQERLMPRNMSLQYFGAKFLTIDHGLAIVARGFDIFVRILRYANVNRRTHVLSSFSSTSFSNSPVDSTWKSLKHELDEWRNIQDTTVRFPDTSVQAHVAFGYGELFTYVNLIFFMSVLFLHRDRLLSDLRRFSDTHADNRHNTVIDSEDSSQNDDDDTLGCIFEAAKNIGVILSAVENSQAPVITPYSGFSVFVAVHVNMYATIAPHKYPGGLKSAEDEKKKNMLYLERLTQFWPVGHQWWHAVQEADKFYGAAKRSELVDTASTSRPNHLALASTLDEYGDIRHQSSIHRVSREGESLNGNDGCSGTEEHQRTARSNIPQDSMSLDGITVLGDNESSNMLFHSLEAELLQWPFIDETWSTGIESGWLN